MSGFVTLDRNIFDSSTGKRVGYVDLAGKEVMNPSLKTGIGYPLVAMIGHSYVARHAGGAHNICTVALLDTAGTVELGGYSGHNTPGINSTPFKITGMGAPFDGYWLGISGNSTYTTRFTCPALVGQQPYSAKTVTPLGNAYMWANDVGNSTANNTPSIAWADWIRAYSGNGFMLPQSYMYHFSGGGAIPLYGPYDPGAVQAALNLVNNTRSRPPQFCFVDYGLNDFNNGQTVSDCVNAVSQALDILNAAGIIPIVHGIEPSNLGTSVTYSSHAYNVWAAQQEVKGRCLYFCAEDYLIDKTTSGGIAKYIYQKTFDQGLTDNHPNMAGSMMVAKAFLDKFPTLFSACAQSNVPVSVNDVFSSSYNQWGSLAPVVSGAPVGVLGLVTTGSPLTLTGTLAQIGTSGIYATTFGGGTGFTATAQLVAFTDSMANGVTKTGVELVLKIIGASANGAFNIYIDGNNNTVNFSSGRISQGDCLQGFFQLAAPTASDISGLNAGANQSFSAFSYGVDDVHNASVNNLNVTVKTHGDTACAGFIPGDDTSPALQYGTFTTPVVQVGPSPYYTNQHAQLSVKAATNWTGTYVVRVRGFGYRKVDPINGEPAI